MKKLFNSKFLFVAVVTILMISVIMLVGCSPFKDAPQGITMHLKKVEESMAEHLKSNFLKFISSKLLYFKKQLFNNDLTYGGNDCII